MFNFLKKSNNLEKTHQPKVFIFMGRSGCGKGTQADFVVKYLCETENVCKTIHIETGALLRKFIQGNSYTQKLTKEVVESGGLMPEAVVVGVWSNYLFEHFSGKENIVFDGCPRKLHEAILLDSALQFYKIEKPTVIYLKVSREWAENRLKERARKDDSVEGVKKRMDWFEKEVLPSIDFFRNSLNFRFFEIDGEKNIEEVRQDIQKRVFGI